jgi:(p)ppGpp synthase/HD superfamily hydrolase
MTSTIKYECIGREEFEKLLYLKMRPDDVALVMDAYNDAKVALDHKQLKRIGGERAFEHSKRVALILILEFRIYDPDMVISALLHDVVEDTFMFGSITEAPDRIQRRYGKRVATFVLALTKEPCDNPLVKADRDHCYFDNIMYEGPKTIIIKSADRLDNLRSIAPCSDSHKHHYMNETRDHVMPMVRQAANVLPSGIRLCVMDAHNEMAAICGRLEEELTRAS